MSVAQSLPELFSQVLRQDLMSSAEPAPVTTQTDIEEAAADPSTSLIADVLVTSSLLPGKPDLAVTSAVAHHVLVACSAFPTDPAAAWNSLFYNLVHNVLLRDAEDPSATAVDIAAVFGAEPGVLKEVTLSPESDPVSVYDVTADPTIDVVNALSSLDVDAGGIGAQLTPLDSDMGFMLLFPRNSFTPTNATVFSAYSNNGNCNVPITANSIFVLSTSVGIELTLSTGQKISWFNDSTQLETRKLVRRNSVIVNSKMYRSPNGYAYNFEMSTIPRWHPWVSFTILTTDAVSTTAVQSLEYTGTILISNTVIGRTFQKRSTTTCLLVGPHTRVMFTVKDNVVRKYNVSNRNSFVVRYMYRSSIDEISYITSMTISSAK